MNVKAEAKFPELFELVQEIINRYTGNRIGPSQVQMVQSRLLRRAGQLGIGSLDLYYSHLIENTDSEIPSLISLLTTHHTFFFREFIHFEKIRDILPALAKVAADRGDNTIHLWSAACSKGHEVYSLAMFMDYWIKNLNLKVSYKILGTDIDPESVRYAQNGVYPYSDIKEVPLQYVSGNWARGTGAIQNFVKVKDHLKRKCEFKVANLISPKNPPNGKFDIILCRNVLIYFDESDVKKSINYVLKHLQPEGLLISGLSESLVSLGLNISSLGNSIYTHKQAAVLGEVDSKEKSQQNKIFRTITKSDNRPAIRILAVDDSPTVLNLLKKTFQDDPEFKIVATAGNGLEAKNMAASTPFDIMILDIHMPEMDGITYLQNFYKKGHPPVIVMSSASREDEETGFKVLKLGAADFVEKPEMSRLQESMVELKTKIKTALAASPSTSSITQLAPDERSSLRLKNVDHSARVCIFSLSHRDRIAEFINSFRSTEAPTFFVTDCNLTAFPGLLKFFEEKTKRQIFDLSSQSAVNVSKNTLYLSHASQFVNVKRAMENKNTVISIFGLCPSSLESQILQIANTGKVMIEDIDGHSSAIRSAAYDLSPWTSFYYLSTKWLKEAENEAA